MARRKESDIPDYRAYPYKAARLALSLERHGVPFEEALDFIAGSKGIGQKDRRRLADWFRSNLPILETKYPEQARSICEGCACCLGGKRLALAKEIYWTYDTLEARIKALLETPYIIGCYGETLDARSFLVNFFPRQDFYRCPCLRLEEGEQAEALPASYCWCCGGHLKHHISAALGTAVETELVSSALCSCGREPCVFKISVAE